MNRARLGGRRGRAALRWPLVVAAIAIAGVVSAQSTRAVSGTVAQRLDKLLATLPAEARIGVAVCDVGTGNAWFEHRADLPLKPASVLKLFTTAAALEHLGPSFVFETRFFLSDDELWVVGGGDPGLGDERIEQRRGLERMGALREIASRVAEQRHGRPIARIVLDDHAFDREWRHPSWPTDQNQEWYQAPVGALNLNDNCVDAKAVAADGVVRLTLVPTVPDEFWANELKPGKETKAGARREDGSDRIVYSGVVAGATEFDSVSANEPSVFYGHALRVALEQAGVGVSGPVVRRELNSQALSAARLVASHKTPLVDAVWRANNFSQNLFAECLIKSLAAYDVGGVPSGHPGSWVGGSGVLTRTLSRRGVALEGARIVDGSGLSHDNRVTAGQVVRLLKMMAGSPHAAVFRESLATPGADGTLRRRFRELGLEERLRAKTGTIRGVSTLAGYLDRADGTRLAFAILLNDAAPESLMADALKAMAEGDAAAGR